MSKVKIKTKTTAYDLFALDVKVELYKDLNKSKNEMMINRYIAHEWAIASDATKHMYQRRAQKLI